MDLILELIDLIDSYKAQNIQVLQNPFVTANKYSSFYKGVIEGKIRSDADAAKMLYNSGPDDYKYKKLKYRFRQRLLNSILFIDVNKPNYTDIQKAYYNCYKDWATVRVLLGKGAKKSAVSIAEKTLRHSLKFEFTELSCNIARVLRLYFATTEGNKRQFNKYNELYQQQLEILQAEAFAESLYGDLLIDFVATRAARSEKLDKAVAYTKQLEPYLNSIFSYNFLFFACNTIVAKYEIANDYENVILYSDKAFQLLSQKVFNLKVQIFPFAFKVFSSYIKLEQYDKASQYIQACQEVLDDGSVNWFKFHQVYFIYLMHTACYREASEVVQLVVTHNRMKYQTKGTKEIWRINGAYAYCMQHWRNSTPVEDNRSNGFKLGKFLNELPVFSKDKRGLNISIIIVQILILLQRKKYNRIIDLISSLERYSSRYLRKNETYRSNCFIKMLISLSRASFSLPAVQRYSEKYFQKLSEVPLRQASQSLSIEIVPYERLWSCILDELGG
ncbi:MAG: hypothetical protein AAFV25_05605 [Bacteroidota bacterium]